ncbi:hypothetical protein Cylst_1991 [Cylindrospermum stagnale PCC 7417]|uniref:Uncharacterized protein n=1 Tax=Cylindrospermum stagnale PCC 7417 TaxID=56107 RepID=K9WWS2_9NOST|nr:hypothetical protein [Cylindrospermum stagnale]AFZ24236.1 hypothetical protein Cylst_1991 [Cylindrospermum stagnale PCC 7417]
MQDLLIKNGLIFDGLGSAPVRGDIGIQNWVLATFGDLGWGKAAMLTAG